MEAWLTWQTESVGKPNQATRGSFEEFHQRVEATHGAKLEALGGLEAVINKALEKPAVTPLDKALRIITKLAANSCGAVQVLVWQGYGNDALNVARSILEAAVNARYLNGDPDRARDYLDFAVVLAKKQREHLKKHGLSKVDGHINASLDKEFRRIRQRFTTRGKKPKLQRSWSKLSLKQRAEKSDMIDHYDWVYPEASSSAHVDIGAATRTFNFEAMDVEAAPSMGDLEWALITTHFFMLALLETYNETIKAGLNDELTMAFQRYHAIWNAQALTKE